jgi:quercetin dioxygenase-like cupin family protein
MLTCSLRRRYRVYSVLFAGLLALMLPAVAAADYHDTPEVIHQTATIPVADPPTAPFHAHQSMLLFTPGAEAPLHRHGGPGYITVLSGELTLYENGVENIYQPGESLVETPDKLYKGGNYTEQGMTLMVTYLVPQGEEVTMAVDDPDASNPPEKGPEPLAATVWDFQSPPPEFDLIHTISTFPPSASTGTSIAGGDILLTVVNGTLSLSRNGQQETIEAGDAVLIEAGQEYTMENLGESDAMAMSTELAPNSYSVLPQAGTPYREPMIVWLLMMTATALLVIGGVLRISAQRTSASPVVLLQEAASERPRR